MTPHPAILEGEKLKVEPVLHEVWWATGDFVTGNAFYEAHDKEHAKAQHLGKWPNDKVIDVFKL